MLGLLPPSSQEVTGYFQLGQAIALLGMNEKQAAEATVWTMLFSQMVEFLNIRSTAIEITAAGIDDAKVKPTRRPR